jgi:outer membrane lipoprotein
MNRLILFAAVVISFFTLVSCAPVISHKYMEKAVKDVSFSQVAKEPEKYLNETFVFGGTIVETRITKEGSEIEVIQNPIDRYGDIADKDVSEGRFLISSPGHLDPLIYRRNRMITVAGRLIGTKQKAIGETQYMYPVFEAEELYLWKRESYYYTPYPFFYDTFYYPYPYYRYWPDPFWYGPYPAPYW